MNIQEIYKKETGFDAYYYEALPIKRNNFQIINKMSKENKNSDKQQNGNDFIADVGSMLVANGLPAFGTKEFNDMCGEFFGGKPKSN